MLISFCLYCCFIVNIIQHENRWPRSQCERIFEWNAGLKTKFDEKWSIGGQRNLRSRRSSADAEKRRGIRTSAQARIDRLRVETASSSVADGESAMRDLKLPSQACRTPPPLPYHSRQPSPLSQLSRAPSPSLWQAQRPSPPSAVSPLSPLSRSPSTAAGMLSPLSETRSPEADWMRENSASRVYSRIIIEKPPKIV